MYYTEFLRVTTGLKRLATVLAIIVALIVTIAAANGALTEGIHGTPDHGGLPLPTLFAIAGIIAATFGSFYACVLSCENDGHLAVAWTKPVSRGQYARSIMLVDAIAIAAAFALALIAELLVIAIFGATRFVEVTPDSTVQFVRFLALPYAFYAFMWALTASFGRIGRGMIGWFWFASGVLVVLGSSELPQPWKAMLVALNYVNPMAYASYSYTNGHDTTNIVAGSHGPIFQQMSVAGEVAMLVALSLAGLSAGVLLWRRVEA